MKSKRNKIMGNGDMTSEHGSATKRTFSPHRPSHSARTLVLVLAALGFCSVAIAGSKIVADPHGPGNHKPTVLETANGTPLVNIQTPSDAGVSRNEYKQFDVDKKGAILNNARKRTRTQLSGWVQGNPWLATGSAKVILNEVHSNDPSQLRGYLEVAGKKAEVVVANPAGITCDGCGFINTNRATLTTGKPQMQDGALKGYRVDNGMIRVSGAGLDASQTDYTRLIARSVKANAGIWANNLKVTTGTNTVSRKTGEIHENKPGKDAPRYALDVGKLGGMYANEIFLVGTEKGVGVRNAGDIGASAGNLVVTASGRLENTGSLQSRQNVTINTTGGVANAGEISASREVTVHTPGDIDNSDGTLSAPRLEVQAAALANKQGTIQQTGTQKLALRADQISNRDGGHIGMPAETSASGAENEKPGSPQPDESDTSDPVGDTGQSGQVANNEGRQSDDGQSQASVKPHPDGWLHIAGLLNNDGGTIANGGVIGLLTADGLNNDGGTFRLTDLTVRDGDLSNHAGQLYVAGDADIHADHINNDQGLWQVMGQWTLDGQRLSNRGGQMISANTHPTTFSITGPLDNSDGLLASNATHWVLNTGALINQAGHINHTGQEGLVIHTGALQGVAGAITTAGDLNLQAEAVDHTGASLTATQLRIGARRFDNSQGQIIARGDQSSTLQIKNALINSKGIIATHGDLRIHANRIDNSEGKISGQRLALDAANLTNGKGRIIQAGTQKLTLHAGHLRNRDGGHIGMPQATGREDNATEQPQSADPDNDDDTTSPTEGVPVASASDNGIAPGKTAPAQSWTDGWLHMTDTLNNDGGTILAGGRMDLIADDGLDNHAGHLTVAQLMLNDGDLDNQGGELIVTGGSHMQADTLDNGHGRLQVAGDWVLNARQLSNRSGQLLHGGTHETTFNIAGTLDNSNGLLASNAAHWRLNTGTLINQAGRINHAGQAGLGIHTGVLQGKAGHITTASSLNLQASDVDHSGATLTATQWQVGATDFNNTQGRMIALGDQTSTLQIQNTLSNQGGTIATNGDLHVQAYTLNNEKGSIAQAGQGQLVLNVADLDGTAGTLVSNGALAITGEHARLAGGRTAARKITIHTGQLTTAGGQLTATGEGPLDLSIGHKLDNSAGKIQTNGALQLTADTLDNAEGTIQAADTATLTIDKAIHNDGGQISGQRLVIDAGSLTNRQGRIIQSGPQKLALEADRISNRDAGHIGIPREDAPDNPETDTASNAQAGGDTSARIPSDNTADNRADEQTASTDSQTAPSETDPTPPPADGWLHITDTLNNDGGTVLAGGAIEMMAARGLDNDHGHLQLAQLTLNGGDLNNPHGELLITGDSYMRVDNIDNDQGQLQVAGDWTLAAGALSNRSGQLLHSGTGDTTFDITGTLDNTHGEMASNAARWTLNAHDLINDHGQLRHAGDQALRIRTHQFTSPHGDIATAGTLNLSADTVDLNHGTVSARQFQFFANDLSSTQGRIVATGDQPSTLQIKNTLNNHKGTIATHGDLAIAARTVNNQQGHIQQAGEGALTLKVADLDGTGGTLASNGTLAVTGQRTQLAKGHTTAQTITIHTGDLTTAGGVLAAIGDNPLTLQIKRTLDNTAGTIQTNGALQLTADGLDNTQGKLLAAGEKDSRITVQKNLNNAKGTLTTAGHLTLQAGQLDNTHGQLQTAGHGALDLTVAGQLTNQGKGQINAAGNATIHAHMLANQNGQIYSGDELHLAAWKTLDNRHGTIAAHNDLHLKTSHLDNRDHAVLASLQGNAALDVAGTLANQQGNVQATGDLTIQSAGLANQSGHIIGGNTRINTTGHTLANQAGTIAATERDLNIHSGTLNNQHGLLQAAGDTTIHSLVFLNTQGLVSTGKQLTLVADSIDNHDTQGDTAQGLQGKDTVLQANQINNQNGLIAADEHLTVTGTGANNRLDNTGGLVSSAGNLTVAADALQNTRGTLLSTGDQTLQLKSFSGDGEILAQGDLALSLKDDWYQTGTIKAAGQGKLTTQGQLVNNGNLYASKLDLRAHAIDNTAEGTINGGQTHITAHDKITNRGLIDGSGTRIDAGTLDNIGTGRIYGDHLAIEAGTLNNHEETVDGQTKAGTIAARERLDIGAGTIKNSEHALIFSAGSGDNALNIGGTLDNNGYATGKAHKVHNVSATIESLGGLTLATDELKNINKYFKTEDVLVAGPERILKIQPYCDNKKYCGRGNRYLASDLRYDPDVDHETGLYYVPRDDGGEFAFRNWGEFRILRKIYETKVIASDPAKILSGGDMTLRGGDLENDDSWIVAGGDLVGSDTVVNDATSGQRRVYDEVHYRESYYSHTGSGPHRKTRNDDNYERLDESSIDLGVIRKEDHTQTSGEAPTITNRRTGQIGKKAQGSTGNQAVHKTGTTTRNATAPDTAQSQQPANIKAQDPDAVEADHNAPASSPTSPTTAPDSTVAKATGPTADTVDTANGSANKPGITVVKAHGDNPDEIRTAHINTAVPKASLFQPAPSAKGYLIETDPAFTDYRQWLSSDYMLKQLQHKPSHVMKRLGDGYYEQRLLREQVTELTGHRYLAGYQDDLSEYKALMNAGIAYAKKYDLTPGVALTADQMAHLTQDMVWLVSQNVTLPDGSTTKALVPRLYVRTGQAEITGRDGLISANSIHMNGTGDLTNTGTIAGRTDVAIAADNIRNLQGYIQGKNVVLNAAHDFDNIGGTLQADQKLIATAGHDLNVETTTRSGASQTGLSSFSHTHIDRVGRIGVTGDNGLLALSTGHNANLTAAVLTNTGPDSVTAIHADNDIKLDTVTTHVQENIVFDANNYLKQGHSRERGTTIDTGSDTALQAGHNLKLRAVDLHSDNGVIIADAGNDLRIENGINNDHWATASKHTSSGFLSSTTTVTRDSQSDTYAAASTLSGDRVALKAGHDLHITASNVAADNDLTAIAGHDLTVDTATNQHHEHHYEKKTASGLFSGGGASGLGGIGFTIGSQKAKATAELGEQTTTASLIGSTQGNVTMAAGDDLTVIGSDVIAGRAKGATTGGDITLQGKNITLTSATQTRHGKTTQHSSQHGLSMALVGTPLDGIRNVQDTRHEQAGSGKKAQDTAYAIGSALGDMPGLAVGYGSARADQSRQIDGTTQRGSSVRAAGNLTLDATDGDLDVIGSTLNAGDTATLAARKDINLGTSADTQAQSSHSSSDQTSYVAAPVSGGDLDRHLHGGVNHSGVSLSPYNTSTNQGDKAQHIINETGTTLTADRINLASHSGDINANGARLTATHDINLRAVQGNIHLGTGTTRKTWQSHQDHHQIGDLGGNGTAATVGTQSREQDSHGQQEAQSTLRTRLTSKQGDINLIAHNDLTGQGVDITGRDVTLVGNNVSLLPSEDATRQAQHSHESHLGITLAASGVAVQAAQAADSAIAAHDRGDNRLAALYAAEAAYGASDAAHTAGSIDYSRVGEAASGHADKAGASPNGDTSLIKATVSIGGGHQSSSSASRSRTQQGSTLTASRDINILATGDGTTDSNGYAKSGNILMQGASVKADHNINLTAARDIHLQSSQNTRKQDQHHSGSSASIGVGFAFGGAQNGFTLELAAAGNKGKAKGTGTTHHATDITAGHTLNLTSGRDTTLHGAQAKGKTIEAHIGRNLTLTSTQDNNHYTEKDQSGGAGLSLCIPPFCYGTSSGSASYSQNDIRNNYQSVTDQTGLAAGKGGFNIHVGHTTTLTGAAIASQATPDKNQLNTGNLKLNSLRNIAISSANKTGASFNTSGSLGSNITQNAKGATLNLAIPQNGYQVSETESRIAKGTIRVRNHPDQDLSGINRDATTLDGNGVTNDFDLDQIKENQELGQAAGYVGMRVAGDIAEYEQRQAVNDLIKAKGKNDPKAEAEAQAKLANWGDGGKYATALHGMIGAATAAIGGGNAAQGALGAVASEAVSGVMQDYLKTHDIKPNSATGNTLMNLASTAIGATTGNGSGAATALYGDKYNRQLHTEEIDWINNHAEQYAKQQCNGCDPSAQQVHEAKAELTQQALRDVDLLWRIHIPEGGNSKQTQHFLETAQGSFTNVIGEQQQLFTTEGNQFIRPLLLADQAGPDTIAFYENYAQPGATRNFSSGFKTEAGQPIGEGAKALGHDMQHLAWWGQAGKALLEDVGHTLVHPIETFDSAKHFALQSGETLKESQHIDAKSQQLNALYGQDVSDDAKFLQHVALGGNLGQIYLTGKGGGITGKVTVGTGKAGAKYLAQTEMGQAVTRATGKAAEQTGKFVKKNKKHFALCWFGINSICHGKVPDEMVTHNESLTEIRHGIEVRQAIENSKTMEPLRDSK